MSYACQHKSLRSRVRIQTLFRIHSHLPFQEFRFAGSTLPLSAGRRDRDSLIFGCLQHCLAAAEHASLTRSDKLDHHARLRDRVLLTGFRSRAAETLLPDSFRIYSEGSEERAAGVHERRWAAKKEVG